MTRSRILVIEDNPLNAEMARFVLTEAAMDVMLATDGEGGLAARLGFDPHLVLMDIQLPDMDGIELALRMRSQPGGDALRLVAFTAFAMVGDKERFLASGFDGYLSKPIDVQSFADSVRSFLPPAEEGGSVSRQPPSTR